ncbi:Dabb family protein [Chitinimonas sp.]|uniref:Dabb family protein n=1 Tax=Chitinimonas sp. TaxID=1934313 RepID=UPI0035B0A841
MLRHLVLFTFQPDLPPAQRDALLAAFAALPTQIAGVRGFEQGLNNSPEGLAHGYTHGFVLTFEDEAGRDHYLHHPAHLAFVEQIKPALAQALVFDFTANA